VINGLAFELILSTKFNTDEAMDRRLH